MTPVPFTISSKSKWQNEGDDTYQGGYKINWCLMKTTQKVLTIECNLCNRWKCNYSAQNTFKDVTNHRKGTKCKKACRNPEGVHNIYNYIEPITNNEYNEPNNEIIVLPSDNTTFVSTITPSTTVYVSPRKMLKIKMDELNAGILQLGDNLGYDDIHDINNRFDILITKVKHLNNSKRAKVIVNEVSNDGHHLTNTTNAMVSDSSNIIATSNSNTMVNDDNDIYEVPITMSNESTNSGQSTVNYDNGFDHSTITNNAVGELLLTLTNYTSGDLNGDNK